MAENYYGKTIRGLAGLFQFGGNRFGPPGIDLDVPTPTVADLTQLGRYGGSFPSPTSDGWWRIAIDTAQIAGTKSTLTTFSWGSDLGGARFIPDIYKMAYVYAISCRGFTETGADISEFDNAVAQINVGDALHTGVRTAVEMFRSTEAMAQSSVTPTESFFCIPRVTTHVMPMPWARTENMFLINNQTSVAGTIQYQWALLVRLMPFGIPPLP